MLTAPMRWMDPKPKPAEKPGMAGLCSVAVRRSSRARVARAERRISRGNRAKAADGNAVVGGAGVGAGRADRVVRVDPDKAVPAVRNPVPDRAVRAAKVDRAAPEDRVDPAEVHRAVQAVRYRLRQAGHDPSRVNRPHGAHVSLTTVRTASRFACPCCGHASGTLRVFWQRLLGRCVLVSTRPRDRQMNDRRHAAYAFLQRSLIVQKKADFPVYFDGILIYFDLRCFRIRTTNIADKV